MSKPSWLLHYLNKSPASCFHFLAVAVMRGKYFDRNDFHQQITKRH